MTTTPATTNASADLTSPGIAPLGGIWKRAGAAIALLAIGTLTLFAVERPSPASPSPKLDGALVAWTVGDYSGPVHVFIETKPGAASSVLHRLRATGASVRVSSTPDLLIADLSFDTLSTAAADQDVIRLSGDVPVAGVESRRSTATSRPLDNLERANGSRLP